MLRYSYIVLYTEMPIRKMLASRKPRAYRRKASGFRKAVATIAKKTLMRQSETKTGWFQQSTAFGSNGTLQAVWSSVSQGDAQQNRDGDKIKALGVRIRGFIGQSGITAGTEDQNAVRVIIASGKRPLTSGDFPTWNGAIDQEIFNLHGDYYINFHTTKRLRYFQKYVKFNRDVLYQGAAVNKNELYVFCVPNGGGNLQTTTGNTLTLSYQMYFKDL